MGTRAGAVGISFLLKKVKEVEKMGIKNLTEAEEKEFYRLVGKMNLLYKAGGRMILLMKEDGN